LVHKKRIASCSFIILKEKKDVDDDEKEKRIGNKRIK